MSREHNAESLELFIVNDGYLYRTLRAPIERALAASKQARSYSHADAVQRFSRLVTDGAAKYTRDISRSAKFTPAERRAVAESLVDSFEAEHRLGNMAHHEAKKSPAQLDREIAQITTSYRGPGERDLPARVEILRSGDSKYFRPGQFGYAVVMQDGGGFHTLDAGTSPPGRRVYAVSKTKGKGGGALWFTEDGIRFTGRA